MNSFLKQIICLILVHGSIKASGQNISSFVVGRVDSVQFDKAAYDQREFQDSLEYANAIWIHDTTENGLAISQGPIREMRMLNPYILTISLQKSSSKTFKNKKLKVRVWQHLYSGQLLENNDVYAFLLYESDSLDIYTNYEYFRVFKTWTGKWARPVEFANTDYPKAKKAFFKYKLLEELSFDYYQIFSVFNECDDVKIYDSSFDRAFLEDYESIKSDTIFAFRYCSSGWGGKTSKGLIVWKKRKKFHYRIYEGSSSKFKIEKKASESLKLLMTEFIEKEIYKIRGEVEGITYFMDDGPTTFMVFKTEDICWSYIHGASFSKDLRVVWANKLQSELGY